MSNRGTPPARTEGSLTLIREEYRNSDVPWVIGFSGGKDSSAVLRLVFSALGTMQEWETPITVVYCDTGVEIPVVSNFVQSILKGIEADSGELGLPLTVRAATPKLEDRYFVKVIGRGYPPPTNKFRWCTNRLRIDPVQRVIRDLSEHGSIVLLGVRRGESQERDRTLSKFETERDYFYRQDGQNSSLIFAPVVGYSTEEIWETVLFMDEPKSLRGRALWSLYGRSAGTECPLVREPSGSPCGKGRFGCWTCTVVRKDQAMSGLIDSGHLELRPLLAFRDWLQAMRDHPENRCPRRRNGAIGLGPLTLAARKTILRRLRTAERESGLQLLHNDEVTMIQALWQQDRDSDTYRSIETPKLT